MIRNTFCIRSSTWLFVATFAMLLAGAANDVHAQDEATATLARKAQNPIASMISFPIQDNINFGLGPYNRTQNVLNLQPVYPSSLGSWALINRVIAPVISQPDISAETGGQFGLGDIVYEGFFTPPASGSVTWGVGPVVILPTATDHTLGTGKWSAGPAVILVAMVNKFVMGAVAYNAWSFAGDGDRASVSQGFFQYFVNYNLPNAWYLSTIPAITVNWEASSGNKWTVPFGGGVGKIFAIGNQKLNGQVQAFWTAIKPDALDGPDWTLRFNLVFLFPR